MDTLFQVCKSLVFHGLRWWKVKVVASHTMFYVKVAGHNFSVIRHLATQVTLTIPLVVLTLVGSTSGRAFLVLHPLGASYISVQAITASPPSPASFSSSSLSLNIHPRGRLSPPLPLWPSCPSIPGAAQSPPPLPGLADCTVGLRISPKFFRRVEAAKRFFLGNKP